MSINAIVESVAVGSRPVIGKGGELDDYDDKEMVCVLGLIGEERGQPILMAYEPFPLDIAELRGKQIWGGACDIMYGETRIAKRVGYNRIEFVVDSIRDVVRCSRASL